MSTQTDLAELYTTFFNRAPDAGGLTYWTNAITTGQLTLAQIAENWTTQQPEGQAAFPATLTDAQFVEKVYGNILGRTSDADGAQYWLDQLGNGTLSRDSFALTLINGAKANTSAQGVLDNTLITNKATVGVAYADKGLNDTTLGAKVLSSVSTDAASVSGTLAIISLIPSATAGQTAAVLASANQLLTNLATLITTAPGEVADASTYLQTLASGATSSTNIVTLLDNASTLLTSAATNPAALDNPAVQGSAAVVVATPGTGGGTPTPGASTFTATAASDSPTLTSGADTFATKFGQANAVAQVDTLTLSGTYEAGDTLTITGVATNPVVVTVTGPSTAVNDILTAISAAPGSTVTAASTTANQVTLTANTPGTGFSATAVAANKPAVAAGADTQVASLTVTTANAATQAAGADTSQAAAVVVTTANVAAQPAGADTTQAASVSVTTANAPSVAQVDTLTVTGTYEAGDTITLTGVATADVVYTVVAADVAGSADANREAIAAKLVDAVTNAAGSTVTATAVSGSTDGALTLTANTAGTGFTSTVTAANKAAVPAVAQVDTVTVTGTYEAGDKITLTGVATADVVYTVVAADVAGSADANHEAIAAKLINAVNNAAGSTVNAAAVSGSTDGALTLTSKVQGTAFTSTVTADNKAAVAAVAQVDTVTLSGTYEAGDTITLKNVAASDVVYTVLAEDIGGTAAATYEAIAAKLVTAVNGDAGSTVTAASVTGNTDGALTLTAKNAGTALTATVEAGNKAAIAAGADTTQAVAVAVTTPNAAAGESNSNVANLDVLTGFTPATDKVDLFSFSNGALAAPTSLVKVADVASGIDLATTLASAFSTIGAGEAGLVTVTGANAGTYLFANDTTAAFSATNDVVIQLTGANLPTTAGTLVVSDYFA